jgi:glycosyltransferase involved in cell wall biosynthesis
MTGTREEARSGGSAPVAYVVTTFPCSTETFILREIETLSSLGRRITVLAAKRGDISSPAPQSIHVAYRPARFSIMSAAAVLSLFRRYPASIVRFPLLVLNTLRACPAEAARLIANLHTIAFFADVMDQEGAGHIHACFLSWPACIASALSRLTGRTFSIAAHARDVFVEPGALKYKIRAARFLVACNAQGHRRLLQATPPGENGKMHICRHGVDALKLRSVVATPRGAIPIVPVIVAAGRLVPKKGIENLLVAAASLSKLKVPCGVRIVGDGPEKARLLEVRRRLRVEDMVEIAGAATPREALAAIGTAALLAVPSVIAQDGDRDGIPNVILEAFALGVPVIASRLHGIMEAVDHMKTGLLVEPADPEALAEAIALMLRDKSLREALASEARKTVESRFDLKENVAQIARLFDQVEWKCR